MDLKAFIRRSQVLEQYRRMVRAAKLLARHRPAQGAEVLAQIRATYRQHRDERDTIVVKSLVADARRQLDMLEALADDAAGTPRAAAARDAYEVGHGWPWERRR
mmetsp:Transcript_12826/g.51433  ORF Transcript_12826/g.51433 Transcript_12826/m.51433 type:complete len:104 (+) Transcript_12826:45-356(+)